MTAYCARIEAELSAEELALQVIALREVLKRIHDVARKAAAIEGHSPGVLLAFHYFAEVAGQPLGLSPRIERTDATLEEIRDALQAISTEIPIAGPPA